MKKNYNRTVIQAIRAVSPTNPVWKPTNRRKLADDDLKTFC